MGRAARRKKLNANYGNLISLKTEKAISQHAAQIIRDLFAECKEVVKNAMAGTTWLTLQVELTPSAKRI